MVVMASSGSTGRARMIRGSVVEQRRRCGKDNCRCADDEHLHPRTVLSYSDGGRNRTVALPAAEVARVRAAVGRYRAAQRRLEDAGNTGLDALLARLSADRRGR
jgi:hypothetical protein